MSSRTLVDLQFDDFLAASSHSPKGKRVRGAVAQVPSDILLSADPEGILVETFALSTLVPANKAWIFNASVDAKKLMNLCSTLKKLGAAGQLIQADIVGRDLVLIFEKTRFSLPTVWVK